MASNDSDPAPPRIGLPTYVLRAQWGAWDRTAALLPEAYVGAVIAAGGIPVLLPPVAIAGAAEAAVDALDGLLLTGGEDIGDHADRDGWERALLDVAMGGSLHQHVPDVVGHEGHRPVPGTYGTTTVKVEPGSRLARIIGDVADVPCHHHQAIDRLADGLTVTAVAGDGIVEAVEAPEHAFVLGVQWHPEDSTDGRLFDALVAAARARATEEKA